MTAVFLVLAAGEMLAARAVLVAFVVQVSESNKKSAAGPQ
jgi:hypothetical protein